MITCTVLPNKDLLVQAPNETRAWLADEFRKALYFNYWEIFASLFEPHLTNGSYEPFDAGEGNPFVGLTSAPCIAENLSIEDDGARTIVGKLWTYDNYMVRDPLIDLRDRGRTVFQYVGEAGEVED